MVGRRPRTGVDRRDGAGRHPAWMRTSAGDPLRSQVEPAVLKRLTVVAEAGEASARQLAVTAEAGPAERPLARGGDRELARAGLVHAQLGTAEVAIPAEPRLAVEAGLTTA